MTGLHATAAAIRRFWRRVAGFLAVRLRFTGWTLEPEPVALPDRDDGARADRLRERPAPHVPPELAALAADLVARDSARASAAASRALDVDGVVRGYLLGFRAESIAVSLAVLGRAPEAAGPETPTADEAIVFRRGHVPARPEEDP